MISDNADTKLCPSYFIAVRLVAIGNRIYFSVECFKLNAIQPNVLQSAVVDFAITGAGENIDTALP